ncbi:DUF1460 domain-containing protein [Carnobacteriaceae bacterium zg-ZUI240]|nr:DUF1460 domain-containing protein [Carnobacteriaceae bacterium zg-ZUI240]
MKKFFTSVLLVLTLLLTPSVVHAQSYEIQFDAASRARANEVFQLLHSNADASEEEKLDLVSNYFKATPYVANRLVGDATTDEQLVLDLNGLDCFTYVDYIEAFKRSSNIDEFISALRDVRYINGEVTYLKRKHFFSDWFSEPSTVATDVLAQPEYADIIKSEDVAINQGANGPYIQGLAVRQRTINYIPRENLTEETLKKLKTGDYIGLRTSIAGLDVTHCGIVIQKEDGTYMRHASSQSAYKQVIDQKLTDYFDVYKRPTGILVFRSNTTFKKQATPALIQTTESSQQLLNKAFETLKENETKTPQEQLDALTKLFLATPYVANRLVGDINTPEQLVVAVDELDCFTFVDYIEAFKRSSNATEFTQALSKVRYIDGNVTYLNRKHFFSDWIAENEMLATDALLDPQYASIVKSDVVNLNEGAKGVYIKGLLPKQRQINYIPRDQLTPELLKTFKTGDYIGLRTSIPGLDVTHCGIIIQKEDGTYMRHASSQKAFRQVIDQKITDYFGVYKSPIGIVVFRPTTDFVQQTPPAVEPTAPVETMPTAPTANTVEKLTQNDVTVAANNLTTNTVLSVTPVESEIKALGNALASVYDITLMENGVNVRGDFTVTIAKTKGNTVTNVYYVSEDGTTKEEIPFTQTETHVTFKTTHFSKYALVYATEQGNKQENTVENKQENKVTTLPETGSVTYLPIAILMLLLSVGFMSVRKEK